MKRQMPYVGHVSRISTIGGLFFLLVGCSQITQHADLLMDVSKGAYKVASNVPQIPFPLSRQCVTVDGTREILSLVNGETPTVEAALDRVNTATRLIEVGDLIVHNLPISGGSDWPKRVSGSVPMTELAKYEQLLKQDPAYNSTAPGQTSALKLKATYLQTLLFAKYPDLYASRKMGAAVPSEAEVTASTTKVLGPGSSPAFTKVFYRLLQYYPAFELRADLFVGKVDGRAMEVYPSLLDAVVSLAENKPEIAQAREAVLQAEDKKAKERRDILDLVQRIQKLEAAEYGNPSTAEEAVQASDRETNAKEIEDLKGQLAVQEEEFTVTVKTYTEEL
ncbi:MAG: hypothetical protein HOP00_04630, partial [Nitrospira sp.]|nr:hypothetical protein [Nitrospira sp.]